MANFHDHPKGTNRFLLQLILKEIGLHQPATTEKCQVCVIRTVSLRHPIISRLTTTGIKTHRIIDCSTIELFNMHRQTMFNENYPESKCRGSSKKKAVKSKFELYQRPWPSINDYITLKTVQNCDNVMDTLDNVIPGTS